MISINSEAVRQRTWRFGRADGSTVYKRIRLTGEGRIQGATHGNESAWRIKEDVLEILDSSGNITTRFDSVSRDASGYFALRGPFLGAECGGLDHTLTEIVGPKIFPGRPRIAVLIRTHIVTEKLFVLLEMMKDGVGYDLFVCADETQGPLPLSGETIIEHSTAMCGEIGLLSSVPNFHLLWYFGDYPFYCAHQVIPDYDYYVMIEYDVDFTRGNVLALEGLLNRLDTSLGAPYDLVAAHYGTRPSEWGWSETCAGKYNQVYGILFPLVVLSKRALLHLFERRRVEALNPPLDGRFVFCEAFVPSELKASSDFRCADLATLLPGSWNTSTFRVGAPLLMGALPPLERSIEFVHPVFSELEYLKRLLADARHERRLSDFVTMLRDPAHLPLRPELRDVYIDEALQLLSATTEGR